MKNYILLLNVLTLTSASLMAMQGDQVAIQTYANVAKSGQSKLPGVSAKLITKINSVLKKHSTTITDANTTLVLDDKEKDTLVKGYQAIHLQLTRLSPEDAKVSELRKVKQLIYTAALKLFTSKTAAKQWLKQADYYSDEEKALDAFDATADNSVYPETRPDYYAAKRSLATQASRLQNITGLEDKVKGLKQDAESVSTEIAQLNARIKQLEEQKNKIDTTQAKITTEMKATNRTIENTKIITTEKLAKLERELKSRSEQTSRLKAELATLKNQTVTLDYEKKGQAADIKLKSDTIARLEMEQTAIQRDIDLLNQDYGIGKKLLWKFTTFLNLYPVKVALDETPAQPTDSLLIETSAESVKEKAE